MAPIQKATVSHNPEIGCDRIRNAIERMFCRLKDFRRIATRYDRRAVNFMAAVCIAATVSYGLSVLTLACADEFVDLLRSHESLLG